MHDLTGTERAILDFESGPHWRDVGARNNEIRSRFDVSPTRYAQLLNALIDRPEALIYAPTTVKRLRRLRQQRREARAAPLPARELHGRARR